MLSVILWALDMEAERIKKCNYEAAFTGICKYIWVVVLCVCARARMYVYAYVCVCAYVCPSVCVCTQLSRKL